MNAAASALRVEWLGRLPYAAALARQESLVEAKTAAPAATPDTLLLLEHDPVYTMGRSRDRSSLLEPSALPYPVETVGRGGQATFHGPGQLVGYPILDLGRRGKDLHLYLRTIEEILIEALAACGVAGQSREGLTGVWVGPRKIASIGVGVRRWISLHGFAVNVAGGDALAPFRAITPCGLAGVEMTAAETESQRTRWASSRSRVSSARFSLAVWRNVCRQVIRSDHAIPTPPGPTRPRCCKNAATSAETPAAAGRAGATP